MRLSAFSALLLLLLLSSCDFNKKEKCIALDSKIATTNDTLLKFGNDWGEELKIAINTLNFSGLQPIRTQMQVFIEQKMVEIKALDNVGGSEKLLATQMEFLELEKEIVINKLATFEQFTDAVQMSQLSDAYASMQVSAVKEQELLEKIHKLRDEYAEKNGFPKYIDKY